MADLTREDVEEALAAEVQIPEDLDDAPPLSIADRRFAQAALRRLRRLQAEVATVTAAADAEAQALRNLIQPQMDDITAFVADRLAALDRQIAWVEQGLEGYMRYVNTEDPDRLSIKTAAGTIALRKNPDRCVVVNPAIVAKVMPEAVKPPEVATAKVKAALSPSILPFNDAVPEMPDGFEARAAVNAAGDVVPGVAFLVATSRTFEVKP